MGLYTGPMDQITVFLNGAWVPNSELHISVDDAGFLLGATVTERFRTFGGQVFRLDEHLDRLRNSLKIIGLDSDAICDQVAAAVPEFLRRNQTLIERGRRLVDHRIRDAGRRPEAAGQRFASTVIRCRLRRGHQNTKPACR